MHDDDHTENHNEDHMEEQDQKNHENISHEIEYNSHVWLNPRLYIKQIENAGMVLLIMSKVIQA